MERVREFEEVQRKDSETLQWMDRRKEQEGKGGKINGKRIRIYRYSMWTLYITTNEHCQFTNTHFCQLVHMCISINQCTDHINMAFL